MANTLIVLLDFIGFLGFTVAFVYSLKNFQKTRHISVTWLPFTLGMAFLAAFLFSNILEWSDFHLEVLDIHPQTLDEIENSILVAAIVSIFTSVLVTREEFLKPVSR
ncbi:MAG: hypothetical protein HYT70_01275 [Candidatus Aenigmarchaeota archaeon]|nr:hypothetical protein [Candidatus Aenigmarchaeota archaeon]